MGIEKTIHTCLPPEAYIRLIQSCKNKTTKFRSTVYPQSKEKKWNYRSQQSSRHLPFRLAQRARKPTPKQGRSLTQRKAFLISKISTCKISRQKPTHLYTLEFFQTTMCFHRKTQNKSWKDSSIRMLFSPLKSTTKHSATKSTNNNRPWFCSWIRNPIT